MFIIILSGSWWLRQLKKNKNICLQNRRPRFDSWARKMPWRRTWQPTPVLWPGESHEQRRMQGTVHGITKSRTWLSDEYFHCQMDILKFSQV